MKIVEKVAKAIDVPIMEEKSAQTLAKETIIPHEFSGDGAIILKSILEVAGEIATFTEWKDDGEKFQYLKAVDRLARYAVALGGDPTLDRKTWDLEPATLPRTRERPF